MTKFTFKDTGEQIKVGDFVYYRSIQANYSKGCREYKKDVKSCEVITMTLNYINKEFIKADYLYSSQEACKFAIQVENCREYIRNSLYNISDNSIIELADTIKQSKK